MSCFFPHLKKNTRLLYNGRVRLLSERIHSSVNQTKKVKRDYATESSNPLQSSSEAKIVRRPKPNDLSRSEIHNKIQNHKLEREQAFQAKIDASKAKKKAELNAAAAKDTAQKIKEATKAEVEVTPEGEPFGDVKKNDPNDPNTKEKLKGVLTAGAFNFSAKERDVLSRILKDQ